MPRKKHRVIIDTNLWISFLLTKDLSKIDLLFNDGAITLLFSQELLDEFLEVAWRPKLRKYFTTNNLQNLLMLIRGKADFVVVTSSVELCRDHKDNFLLALAVDGKASHLITGDKDLLSLGSVGPTQILTIAEYLSGL
ncbi:putative toxin-antitoxin system toxin component, PIN family [Spirosoma sp. KUDC1026]|uniref:putative toxin-antitoxin system toxin component, PIN family n=1 Tax=Spirosoma sp. KUDC1026 TaxID=2745947 RepID=UPI00159BB5B6|nr:putative toxin-antitoxin system toxin component, PIN family [Spirosoma sp. KUDC1026]QKZ12903.1 putative toxin-antitoxin system toxin component, PIN family [Spirosoma sp. KUDC1026]